MLTFELVVCFLFDHTNKLHKQQDVCCARARNSLEGAKMRRKFNSLALFDGCCGWLSGVCVCLLQVLFGMVVSGECGSEASMLVGESNSTDPLCAVAVYYGVSQFFCCCCCLVGLSF